MVSPSSSSYQLLFCLLVLVFTPFPSHSADPDPLQDFCVADLNATLSVNGYPCKPKSQVTSEDFFFDGLIKEGNVNIGTGVLLALADVQSFPGLNTLGLSMIRADFAPGGLIPPHTHPRASETGVVIEGKLLVGFVTTDNVLHSKVLNAGQMFLFPRGLLHFALNVGEGKARILVAFDSQLPGIALVSTSLFASTPPVPNQVLTKTFLVGDDVINEIKSKFGA
ncbi:Germin [Trema orientale]|uniref:Germin-like protein n=1 Tax=Trema orientale TaxID=63057 RepID=A0A2P5EKS2_TREOI|nr:Germin [Trema orientale]